MNRVEYGLLNEEQQEHVPGIDPATGQPDSRFDGTVTASVPIRLVTDGPIHAAPDPHAPTLVEVARSSDLMIARDLGTGLAQLAEDGRLRAQAAELRRGLDPRRQ